MLLFAMALISKVINLRYIISVITSLLIFCSPSHGSGIESITVQNSPSYINISWATAAGSSWDYYTVDVIKSSQRSVGGYPTNTIDTTHLITGLKPEEQCTIVVTPWTTEGAGRSLNITVTTEAIAEGEILVSDVTSSSAFIQWKPVAGLFFYGMEAEPSDAIEDTGGIFEAEVGLTILLPGTVFTVTLRGGSPVMDLASTQIRSAPESPVNVSLKEIGTTEATLSWTPPTSPHDAYEFYVINNSTNERSPTTTKQRGDVSDNEVTLTGLSPATIYSFGVGSVLNAMDSFGLQRSGQDDNPTVYGRTESITVQNSPSYINISWATAEGSSWDYYTVDVLKSSQQSVNGYPTNTTDTTHLITGLKPEEKYKIVVTPWTTEGAGNSLIKTVTTEAIAEGEILVSDVTSSSAFIQWKPVAGLSFYDMEAEPSDAIEGTGGIFEAEVGLTILLPGTVFTVTLRGGRPVMDLASTQIRSAPESPVSVSLKQTGTTEATLSWTPPTSPHDAYEFYVINNSTNERLLIPNKQRDDVSENEVTLTGLSPATIYSFGVGSVLNATDSFELQRSGQDDNPTVYGRTGPEALQRIELIAVSDDSVTVMLTPPRSRHNGYERFLFNPPTTDSPRITTIQREDDMTYIWTESGLSPFNVFTLEVGTFLNAEGPFPMQKSEDNLSWTFQKEPQTDDGTGNAVSPTLHYTLLIIPALLAVFLV
ncbi:tenascin-R-like isoform X2 [Strongylocentrotus purpuratus]|uniref:Fibronectin type-III domain-containing protein n=1 Tax=Strongylocentrotus purpuratus TaxID=7668 RepID=A0A7M7PHK0_STRPU|nr:tenascin-R-like isoform X2 [Strongylocentrotus purpuratus]XP_030852001.1 tenascin-R-like isoform X2 [Strongylocentrotus purpuratus]